MSTRTVNIKDSKGECLTLSKDKLDHYGTPAYDVHLATCEKNNILQEWKIDERHGEIHAIYDNIGFSLDHAQSARETQSNCSKSSSSSEFQNNCHKKVWAFKSDEKDQTTGLHVLGLGPNRKWNIVKHQGDGEADFYTLEDNYYNVMKAWDKNPSEQVNFCLDNGNLKYPHMWKCDEKTKEVHRNRKWFIEDIDGSTKCGKDLIECHNLEPHLCNVDSIYYACSRTCIEHLGTNKDKEIPDVSYSCAELAAVGFCNGEHKDAMQLYCPIACCGIPANVDSNPANVDSPYFCTESTIEPTKGEEELNKHLVNVQQRAGLRWKIEQSFRNEDVDIFLPIYSSKLLCPEGTFMSGLVCRYGDRGDGGSIQNTYCTLKCCGTNKTKWDQTPTNTKGVEPVMYSIKQGYTTKKIKPNEWNTLMTSDTVIPSHGLRKYYNDDFRDKRRPYAGFDTFYPMHDDFQDQINQERVAPVFPIDRTSTRTTAHGNSPVTVDEKSCVWIGESDGEGDGFPRASYGFDMSYKDTDAICPPGKVVAQMRFKHKQNEEGLRHKPSQEKIDLLCCNLDHEFI